MALDGKILARAKDALAERRQHYDEMCEIRLQKAYIMSPRIKEIDAQLRETMIELVGAAFKPDGRDRIDSISARNLSLQEERREEIARIGMEESLLDGDFLCVLCHDSGYRKGEICKCLMELYTIEQAKELSSLLNLGKEIFENFNLDYYSSDPDPETGISPRESMEVIFEMCREYARRFGKRSVNLFFNGAPGLGKTFLSSCIARVVSENGFSVVYNTAGSIFAKFEDAKFNRTDDQDTARAEIKRILECELLIFDDLGTEMTTAFTISALYEIINTRLITGRKTIVSSNLTMSELHARYSEQIMSRLEGEFQVLTFRGSDIRKIKNS